MEESGEFMIHGSRIKILAIMPGDVNHLLNLVTGGDTGHIMASIGWFRRRRLDTGSFVDYFLKMIVRSAANVLQSNKRLITSKDMEILIQVEPLRPAFGRIEKASDSLAQYNAELSSPSFVFIAFFPEKDFFARFMKNGKAMDGVIVHEMQHHASMGFEAVMQSVTARVRSLRKLGRMSYGGWIAIAALLELKNEGAPTFSEWANNGVYLFDFVSMGNFVGMFMQIPQKTKKQLTADYPVMKHNAYLAGLTMLSTILLQRLIAKQVTAYVKPVNGPYEPLQAFRRLYGVENFYVYCPHERQANYSLRAQNEAKRLLAEMQDESHLYFLSAYESACGFLGVRPLVTRQAYVQVKGECHMRFLSELQAAKIPIADPVSASGNV